MQNAIWTTPSDISKYQCFFHNLKNYDGHLILSKADEMNERLNKKKDRDNPAQNSEKFIAFSFELFTS